MKTEVMSNIHSISIYSVGVSCLDFRIYGGGNIGSNPVKCYECWFWPHILSALISLTRWHMYKMDTKHGVMIVPSSTYLPPDMCHML